MPTDLAGLGSLLRPDQIDTSESTRALHSRGESCDVSRLPDVVVFAESTEDVVKVVRYANETRTPVTPVAMNSSVEGHTVPLRGGISLDVTRMNRILEVAPEDFLAVVQPAVTYPALNARLRPTGLFFPIDPGAEASLGGMASTNASGTMAVRYGVTKDLVLGMEVVTPTGQVIRTGGRAPKSSSGYDLTRLFCGAEGTLGVITELTVRLVARPASTLGARASFATVQDCVRYVTELIQAGAQVARCELVDVNSIQAIRAHVGLELKEADTVFLEFHGDELVTTANSEQALELARDMGAIEAETATNEEDLRRLWHARHQAFYAMLAVNPGMANLLTDIAVPMSKLADVIDAAKAAVEDLGLPAYVLGHVGDGNFHMAIFYDESDAEARRRVTVAHDELVSMALAAGGTCTGEHGVGLRKLPYVAREHGPAVAVMWAVKDALDPNGIMNPGKKLPPLER